MQVEVAIGKWTAVVSIEIYSHCTFFTQVAMQSISAFTHIDLSVNVEGAETMSVARVVANTVWFCAGCGKKASDSMS